MPGARRGRPVGAVCGGEARCFAPRGDFELRVAPGRLGAVVAACAILALPAAATAAARGASLTISATPNPNVSGAPVLVYGQLNTGDRAGQIIRLFHRVNPATRFTLVDSTTTTSAGFYEFVRADGITTTNRSWYVAGPGGVKSRVIDERASALLSLAASTDLGLTGQPFTFSGEISPTLHAGEPVILQKLAGGSVGGWSTVARGVIGADSTYSFSKAFVVPGAYELRASFAGDAVNILARSDAVTVTVEQAQNPSFTIATSAPVVDEGQSATISGTLYEPGSTTAIQAGRSITLWAHPVGQAGSPMATATTGSDGSYSFPVTPVHNLVYVVHATGVPAAKQVTAALFEGVRDVVSLSARIATAAIGESLTLTGTVSPDHTGHAVELEQLGSDGSYHTVSVGTVSAGSSFEFTWVPGSEGTMSLRAEIAGGPVNVRGVSPVVTIAVSLPPVSSLPAA